MVIAAIEPQHSETETRVEVFDSVTHHHPILLSKRPPPPRANTASPLHSIIKTSSIPQLKPTETSTSVEYVRCGDHLDLLGYFLLFNAGTASAIEAVRFVEAHGLIFHVSLSSMIFLFKDHIRLDGLELGLEVADGMAMGAAIGATTSIGEGVAIVVLFFAWTAPTS